jgi:hypothetical protein
MPSVMEKEIRAPSSKVTMKLSVTVGYGAGSDHADGGIRLRNESRNGEKQARLPLKVFSPSNTASTLSHTLPIISLSIWSLLPFLTSSCQSLWPLILLPLPHLLCLPLFQPPLLSTPPPFTSTHASLHPSLPIPS